MTGSLFDLLGPVATERHCDWTPPEPPPLDGIHDIQFDTETNGLRWWAGDRPIGISICLPDARTFYLPWAHRGGGNLQEEQVKRWAQRELRGKRLTGLNTRFDVHMLREWGIDLEEQGNEVSDVGHYAALLDDHRKKFNLNILMKDFLKREKVGMELDGANMANYHAGEVAPRAEGDALGVHDLIKAMWPELDKQDLQRVRQLEDEVIYVVCEMEKNGSPIDMELLEKWDRETQILVGRMLMDLSKECGFQINPASNKDLQRVFEKFGLPIEFTENGAPSFTDEIKKRIEHPVVVKLRRVGKLMSLRSKYITKGRNVISSDGILRYALHQLRTAKDENADKGEAGTISGRFSSTAIIKDHPIYDDEGDNIQQRMKVQKQRIAYGYKDDDSSHDFDPDMFLVRRLHIPGSGLHLAADAMQIEYRIFASYAGNKTVLEAYRKNTEERLKDPTVKPLSFHKFVHSLIKPYVELDYRRQKDVNFAKLYGAGIKKMALMTGFITAAQFQKLTDEKAKRTHPLLREILEVDAIYNREMPEVKSMLKRASKLAEDRGYVCTLLGRRIRFPIMTRLDGTTYRDRLHKAFNGVDQGGAADINKRKLVELHKARKYTNFLLRWTVHDEMDGDIPDMHHAEKVREVLDQQSFPELQVPIHWDIKAGPNWAACAGD